MNGRRAIIAIAVTTFIIGCGAKSTTDLDDAAKVDTGNMTEADTHDMAGIEESIFGKTPDGREVTQWTLTNSNGLSAKIINYGAIVVSLEVPDRNGNMTDIVLGCDTVKGYAEVSPYFGAIAGRYANRIALGKFTLDGQGYVLATNNGPNHLHGGNVGFDKVLWEGQSFANDKGEGVKLTYVSKDGEEGYPGNFTCTVTYTLTNENELKVEIDGETDKPSPVNLTHHGYFNLAGHDAGDITEHELTIFAARYTPTDETLIPTGDLAGVEGTPYDFRENTTIGERIDSLPDGYDMNYVLDSDDGSLALAARVREPKSGRVMEIYTTEPGLQFYTGRFLDVTANGKNGATYNQEDGFCLEGQHFPDSPNQPGFPSSILRPGERYRHVTVHKFLAE